MPDGKVAGAKCSPMATSAGPVMSCSDDHQPTYYIDTTEQYPKDRSNGPFFAVLLLAIGFCVAMVEFDKVRPPIAGYALYPFERLYRTLVFDPTPVIVHGNGTAILILMAGAAVILVAAAAARLGYVSVRGAYRLCSRIARRRARPR
jgi:hypothetical protein